MRAVVTFNCRNSGCVANIEHDVIPTDPSALPGNFQSAHAYDAHSITCPSCLQKYEVETVNGIGGISARIMPSKVLINAESYFTENDFDLSGFDLSDFEDEFIPSKDPLGEYQKSSLAINNMLGMDGDDPRGVLNRMVLSQYMATMEAYLTDKILVLCDKYQEISLRVVEKVPIFIDANIPLKEVIRDPAAARRQFRAGLQSMLYHDLDKVSKLYGIAIGAQLFPSSKHEEILREAVVIRHDCVHRNGFTKSGELRELSATDVRKVAGAIQGVVDAIEGKASRATQELEVQRRGV